MPSSLSPSIAAGTTSAVCPMERNRGNQAESTTRPDPTTRSWETMADSTHIQRYQLITLTETKMGVKIGYACIMVFLHASRPCTHRTSVSFFLQIASRLVSRWHYQVLCMCVCLCLYKRSFNRIHHLYLQKQLAGQGLSSNELPIVQACNHSSAFFAPHDRFCFSSSRPSSPSFLQWQLPGFLCAFTAATGLITTPRKWGEYMVNERRRLCNNDIIVIPG